MPNLLKYANLSVEAPKDLVEKFYTKKDIESTPGYQNLLRKFTCKHCGKSHETIAYNYMVGQWDAYNVSKCPECGYMVCMSITDRGDYSTKRK